ncbi:hypothetical protein B0I33_104513 [Prauserella shujinwangii]|uniref:DUF6879 domain-containing protein n=1 Tax=Prauserella shujinwangii TaxID=1453103 RepID=A0A2T0LXE8_9PSEU|nr:DUF6879 family protein [Prauserella shujinwangii]PRX48695.1 hypothetical protein B0I33_104513 [Prauserella shujinwangii]
MGEAVSVEQFDQLYTDFERSVWRWEAQPAYHEPGEAEPFRRWQAGEPDDLAWLADWLDILRAATAAGRSFQRVRLCHEPPTEYQRWGLTIVPANIDAGEDVRIMTESRARELGMPDYDFCLFDDRTVARMHFGGHGMTGAEIITEPDAVAQHRRWRDLAQEHAVTLEAYLAKLR